jgi:apolipoprotein N-acyltransferase
LIVPGIAGLLLSLQGLRGWRARGIGFLHGMVACGVALPWMWLLFGPFALALWGILAAFNAAIARMQIRAEARGFAGIQFALFTVVNWCGWEFIRAELFPLKFPWMTPGLAWGPSELLPLVGVYGAGVAVVFLATCFVHRRWWTAAGTFLVMVGMTPLSKWGGPMGDEPDVIPVAGLQFESASVSQFLQATRDLPEGVGRVSAKIKHVVWPEYAVPYDVRASKSDWAALQKICRERNITLTLGTQTRPKERPEWFNTALTLDATGVLGEHYKAHPVHFFDDGTPGTVALPVNTTHGKIGTPICFDCDYEGIVRRMTAAGAEAFIVPMMDEMSWSKRQHDQHAELFRIRACENARWFFVCGTSGVSQVIDANGQVRKKLPAMEQGVLTDFIRRRSVQTFYTRWGWLTPWLLLGAAAVCWIALLLPRRPAKERVP